MARAFTSVRVTINQAALREFQRSAPIARDFNRRGLRVRNRAVQLCPVNKEVGVSGGGLRSSIRLIPAIPGSEIVAYVGSSLDYAIHVHEGTDPHPIHAREKNVLWWGETMLTPRVEGAWRGQYSGQPIFISPPWTRSYSVNHPGNRPNPFLRLALPAAA